MSDRSRRRPVSRKLTATAMTAISTEVAVVTCSTVNPPSQRTAERTARAANQHHAPRRQYALTMVQCTRMESESEGGGPAARRRRPGSPSNYPQPDSKVLRGGYDERIAITGSMRAARAAGIQHAAMPIAAIATTTAVKVTGSCGAIPNRSPRMTPAAK